MRAHRTSSPDPIRHHPGVLLFDSRVSGNCYKVRLLLAHLGREYERREVDVVDRSNREEILGRLNPGLRVPTLVLDDERALAESTRDHLLPGRGLSLSARGPVRAGASPRPHRRVAAVPAPTPGEFVFAYGSLVPHAGAVPTRAFHHEGFVTDLRDFRRCWGVAMSNRVTLPGYKYYLDERGDRPDVYVTFLDLRPARGRAVNGVCMPVTPEELPFLDRRERNYVRRDVSAFFDLPGDVGRVWTYVGSPAGRRRLTLARSAGCAVVDRDYLEAVLSAFKTLGPAEYDLCAPSLDTERLPLARLTRHDLTSTTITT